MKAKSIKGRSSDEIKAALTESMADSFKPTLAFVFLSVSQDRKAICSILDKAGIAIFGSTTNGEFIDEETESGAVAILLLDMKKEYFKIHSAEFHQNNYRDTSKSIASKAKKEFGKVAFLLAVSNAATDGEEVLLGLQEIAGEQVNAFGGAAGDDLAFSKTWVFTNGWESDQGMVCLALNEEKVSVSGIATCGWKAMGTEKTVTKSEGNHVFTIDNEPALDITTKYGGLENITPENKDVLLELAANFPLQLQREKGDPVMRPGLVVDWSDHSFYTSGSVPQGSKIRFSLPPDWDVMERVVKGVQNLKDTEMPEADALVVFSCAGRILSFGPMMNAEIEGVKQVWNVPMAGMFSYAELGRMAGGNLEMHNLTTCCVALKEK
ncbi:FIST C-terminal domain-containing protein [Algoriphagus lutimaris]|uniref:FIST signal transduction protein n=1 Tax=Algoriphagus lutimaris TaxID=613197 RepID=UPI00196A5F32|nr:FIST N-terminal domain-containing protein [Algoriphagus lutimaris]MBN3520999.1 FIST C-terminal domain-containing protein [Algoriphagus lutimaris]